MASSEAATSKESTAVSGNGRFLVNSLKISTCLLGRVTLACFCFIVFNSFPSFFLVPICHTLSLTARGLFGLVGLLRQQTLMNIEQIHETVSLKKPVSRRQLFRYMSACNIQPLGVRQRPQRFPTNAPERIFRFLGFNQSSGHRPANQPARLVSTNTLRAIKRKAGAK